MYGLLREDLAPGDTAADGDRRDVGGFDPDVIRISVAPLFDEREFVSSDYRRDGQCLHACIGRCGVAAAREGDRVQLGGINCGYLRHDRRDQRAR